MTTVPKATVHFTRPLLFGVWIYYVFYDAPTSLKSSPVLFQPKSQAAEVMWEMWEKEMKKWEKEGCEFSMSGIERRWQTHGLMPLFNNVCVCVCVVAMCVFACFYGQTTVVYVCRVDVLTG